MMPGIVQDQNLERQIEKQMGCMAGFLQLFDRNQLLTGKRLYTTKRLSSPADVDVSPEPEKFVGSAEMARELDKPLPTISLASPSPDCLKPYPTTELRSPTPGMALPADLPPKSPLLPIFEFKEGTRSSWKFCKEAPRLSLDSRANFDAKGSLYAREIRTNDSILSANQCDNSGDGDDKQRRSPSVVARLMGLEQLPHSNPEPIKKAELRRSASESRASRDLFHYRFIEGHNFQQSHSVGTNLTSNVIRDNATIGSNGNTSNVRPPDSIEYSSRKAKCEAQWRPSQQRKSFFDSADIFPEPKQTMSVYGEIEQRLKMRGIDDQSKDLDTLKQILEALQLKGLLHSTNPSSNQIGHKNFVHNWRLSSDESPIVVMKPWSSVSPINQRTGNDSPPSSFRCKSGVHRSHNLAGENVPSVSPRRERPGIDRSRNSTSPARNESSVKCSNSPVKRKPLSIETQRRVIESTENRRVSPIHSPKLNSKRIGLDQTSTNRSPRNKKPTAEIYSKGKITTTAVTEDESSSISGSTVSSSSQTDTERLKMEEYKEGGSILERCDKLLQSIAAMTATELQPSPVSVLDSSFYKDESLSPSPVMKRSIDFRDQMVELEEEIWSPVSPAELKCEENSDDCDFVYISEIIRAFNYLPEDSDIFLLLEKQQYLKGNDTSNVSRLQRKVIFDTITEILERNRQLPAWKKAHCGIEKSSPKQIWSEFQRIRERESADDPFVIICGVLKRDLAGDTINGWGDCPMETAEAVLYIERLIFKDLVAETIGDLADFARKCSVSAPRRKLIF